MDGQDYIRRFDNMGDDSNIDAWKTMWQECTDWGWPLNDNINRVRVQGMEKPVARMIDTCIEANYIFATGMFSRLYPQNTPWAQLSLGDEEVMKKSAIQKYYGKCSSVIASILKMSNFYSEEQDSMMSIGILGTNSLLALKDPKKIVRFKNRLIDDLRLEEDHDGIVSAVGYECELTNAQLVSQFGEKKIKETDLKYILEADHTDKRMHKVIHIVEPAKRTGKARLRKKYVSVYIHRETATELKRGGFDYFPYFVGRPIRGNGEVYGRSLMSMKLGTARRTNSIYRSTIIAGEHNANPQWVAKDGDEYKNLGSGRAGTVVKYRTWKPERVQNNGDAGLAHDLFLMHDEEIKRAFFNNVMVPLDDNKRRTIFEATEKVTSENMMLAPFINRYLQEKISPIIMMVYDLAKKKDMLPTIPEEAKKLESQGFLYVDYVSKIAQTAKNYEVQGTIATIATFAELSGAAPALADYVDNIDGDDLFLKAIDANHGSRSSIVDETERDAKRRQRAEQQAQQQQIENVPKLADAEYKLRQQ